MHIYFNKYCEIIEQQHARYLGQNIIYSSFIRTAYAESTPLFKICNNLKADETTLGKIALKNISHSRFSLNVTLVFLNTYDPVCRINKCWYADSVYTNNTM